MSLFWVHWPFCWFGHTPAHIGVHVRKLWVSNKERLKPACSVTETTYNIEILHGAHLATILYIQRITKVLIRLWACAGWSASLLFPCNKVRFSHIKAHIIYLYCKQGHALLRWWEHSPGWERQTEVLEPSCLRGYFGEFEDGDSEMWSAEM